MFKNYYLAYGSNLNLRQMEYRCSRAIPIGSVLLDDYRLVYKGRDDMYAYLTIEKCIGYKVPLGVFEVSLCDILSLDRYEGYPKFYSKFYFSIRIDNKNKEALIYIMNSNFDYHLPSREYVKTCEEGYDNFGFDQSILDKAYTDTICNMQRKLKKYF